MVADGSGQGELVRSYTRQGAVIGQRVDRSDRFELVLDLAVLRTDLRRQR